MIMRTDELENKKKWKLIVDEGEMDAEPGVRAIYLQYFIRHQQAEPVRPFEVVLQIAGLLLGLRMVVVLR